MSNVALLMSIRDQLNDMLNALKAAYEPEIIEDERERAEIHRIEGYSPIAEYHFADEERRYRQLDVAPTQVKYWRKLRPVKLQMDRLDRYIEAAKKNGQG